MSGTVEKCREPNTPEGTRPYKCRDYPSKMALNLHTLKRDGRFCDIDLISGSKKIKVGGYCSASFWVNIIVNYYYYEGPMWDLT